MTADYFAIAGEEATIRECLGERGADLGCGLHLIFDRPGISLFASRVTPTLVLEGLRGVVIGRLFRSGGRREPIASLGQRESRAIHESRGHWLIEHCWGNYVALLGAGPDVIAVRDPSAAIPAYHRQHAGIQIYCSDFALARSLAGEVEVDELFVRQWLSFPFLRTARTGLSGWREIPPGSSHSPAGGTSALWTPAEATRRQPVVQDFDEAAGLVRRTALATIGRIAADLPAPLLELSGGLDSSIVAACLHANGIRFDAFTFATRQPDGDERRYAALVAAHFGVALAELEEDQLPLQLELPPPSLRPPLSPVLQPLDRARMVIAAPYRDLTFVTGAGGDNIFCYLATAAPILDAWARQGIAKAVQVAGEVADLGECTIFKALRYAAMKAWRRRTRPDWQRDNRFLSNHAIAGQSEPHPWLSGLSGMPPGKVEHVEALVRAQHFLEPRYAWGWAVCHPLLNQPLMEACLSIPSWLWVDGGRNRAVARAAFAGMLPAKAIHRRTKGRLESMCARSFMENRREIATLLLSGELARRELIDRTALGDYLRSSEAPQGTDYFRIFDLVSMELWLRSWR